jgi:hypothetical protein
MWKRSFVFHSYSPQQHKLVPISRARFRAEPPSVRRVCATMTIKIDQGRNRQAAWQQQSRNA